MTASEKITQEELIKKMLDMRARDIITFAKILVSQVGKEKAKDLIKKARWDAWNQRGEIVAEKAGNPQDLDSYIEEYFIKEMGLMPWVPPTEWDEKTKTKAVTTYRIDCIGKSLAELGDEDIREIVREAYCVHDIAWAKGFNPNIKIEMTKTFCAGDDCCQFVIES